MYASVPSQYLDLLWLLLLLLKISSVSVLERVSMLVLSSVKMFSFRFLVCFLLLLLLLLRRAVRKQHIAVARCRKRVVPETNVDWLYDPRRVRCSPGC